MSYSLNSSKGSYIGDNIERIIGVMKSDTRRLDYSPYNPIYSPI